MSAEATAPGRQSTRFLLLYALAWAGGAIAYVPFLTILLPVRVTGLGGAQSIEWLSYIAFSGAIAASIANILFGWLSDLSGRRRPWIVTGLVLSCLLLVTMPRVTTLPSIILLVVAWQFALNLMLGPLSAWAGDCVPDHQKGLLGGLLPVAPALGAMAGALVTLPGLAAPEERLWLVALLVAAAVLPVVVFGNPRPFPELTRAREVEPETAGRGRGAFGPVEQMWLARLLVQISEAALFAFLYLWLRSIQPGFSDNRTATLFTFVLAASIPVALLAGRWADRRERPILPLAIGAFAVALGLVAMGISESLTGAIAGYVIFGIAGSTFLALHSAQTLRVLPRPEVRGRDLGLFNLTNTVPSLVMPWLTLGLVPVFGFTGLFLLLAGLATMAGLLLLPLARRS